MALQESLAKSNKVTSGARFSPTNVLTHVPHVPSASMRPEALLRKSERTRVNGCLLVSGRTGYDTRPRETGQVLKAARPLHRVHRQD